MAQSRRAKISEEDVQGLKFFKILNPLLQRLHGDATERDRAHNRKLHFDQYTSLLVLYFFNPILTSLRGIEQASHLKKIQKGLRLSGTSLGSLSEAGTVFDPALLRDVLRELALQATPLVKGREAKALQELTAVDGSLLPALPKMAWALWRDDTHRAAKLHLHFDVFKGVPADATVTEGSGSERAQLRQTLQPGRLYVMDRGYLGYEFFQQIIDARSSFICRIKENASYRVIEQREISEEAKAAGVIADVVVDKLGSDHHKNFLKQPVRIVTVDTGETDKDGEPVILILATDLLDLSAQLVSLGFRYRWSVELFFRWFKCVLGCRHLLAHSRNGLTIQVYAALIASLLISLWTGRKPTKRTFEMLCFFFAGLAEEDELLAHIEKLKKHTP